MCYNNIIYLFCYNITFGIIHALKNQAMPICGWICVILVFHYLLDLTYYKQIFFIRPKRTHGNLTKMFVKRFSQHIKIRDLMQILMHHILTPSSNSDSFLIFLILHPKKDLTLNGGKFPEPI